LRPHRVIAHHSMIPLRAEFGAANRSSRGLRFLGGLAQISIARARRGAPPDPNGRAHRPLWTVAVADPGIAASDGAEISATIVGCCALRFGAAVGF
jgi:hypothetical protein